MTSTLCAVCDQIKELHPNTHPWTPKGQHPTRGDFLARLADAWDGKGRPVLTPYKEHRALLILADLPLTLERARWANLEPEQRVRLLFAARAATELGAVCRWVFE